MQYTKFLRWGLLGGLALIFFIPFVVADGSLFPNMYFPFITGKNFAFRILVEVLLGAYILLALREPKYRPQSSYLLWAVGAFVAWAAVATLVSVDPSKSFWSNFERMEGYITVLHLFAYFVIMSTMAAAEGWWNRLFQISIVSGTLQALYSLGQLLHVAGLNPSSQSGPRLDGTFGNATYLAVFMFFNIFLTLFMLVRERRSSMAQMLYGLALVLQVAVLYYTQTRGTLLGLLGGLLVAGLYIVLRAKGAEWKQWRKYSLYGLGALAVVVVVFLAARESSFVKKSETLSRFASISLTDRTTTARFQIWNMAYQGFVEKPLMGWGQENFSYVFNKYYSPEMYSQEQWFDRAHNQFLDWLIAGGLPAFVLYISFFVLVVWAVMRAEALSVPEQAIILGLLAGYAFNNLLVFDDLMSSVYFFSILAFAHGLSRRGVPRFMFLSKPTKDTTVAAVAPFVFVAIVLGGWALNAPGIARAQNLLNAVMTQVPVSDGAGGIVGQAKDPKTQLAQFKTVLGGGVWPGTGLGWQESVEQLMQFSSNLAPSTSIDPALKQEIFVFAQSSAQTLLESRQHDARLELFYGAFEDTYGRHDEAIKILNQALVDSPKKQQIMFQLGVVHLNVGDTQGALAPLKAAFEEAPSYNDARILYAAVLFYNNQNKEADALLTEGFGTVLVNDSRLLQVYANTKQFDRVQGIWKNRIAASPKDAQLHAGLASAYFAGGDKTNAIAELRVAGQLDPALAAQVQTLITQIQNGTLK